MFVFGDSLLDPGNNNNLLTLAKANYFPNGIDFSIGTTGRYCNGGTLVDHLGKLLGLPFVPTFKNPSTNGSNILKGVNYASAGAGILWDTGLIFGDVFTMDEQIQNFKKTIEDLSLMLGNKTTDFLGRSLFFISMGANDYINNYLHPLAWRYKKYPIVAYEQLLVQEYSRQIKDIYDLGARKIFVSGVPPLGCIPNQIGGNNDSSGECIRSSNRMAVSYNNQVSMLAGELNATLAGASFLFWNNYKPVYDIIHNYSLYGVENAGLGGVCGGGREQGSVPVVQCLGADQCGVPWEAHSNDVALQLRVLGRRGGEKKGGDGEEEEEESRWGTVRLHCDGMER
ncbi:hypothetical protein ZIOFF_065451 [Zingiber officinale]|uniref:GDSL esterase/lipase n=1 Tax=Zingiber officinale TaxID=94328 RepID=A0A8J5F1W5_ZINOF|nr:hypothetical protein ZIOFF_065451 [Zingiber officinale]